MSEINKDWKEISRDGMPPYGNEVNVFPMQFTKNGVGTMRVYNDGNGGSVFEKKEKITHWRYLPDPPEGLSVDEFGYLKGENPYTNA